MKIRNYFPPGCRHLLLAILATLQFSASACLDLKKNEDTEINAAITEIVTPFSAVNSEFDDFNSGPGPILEGYFPLYFSSNRDTQGGTFDIESMLVHGYYNRQNDGDFSMEVSPVSGDMVWPGTNSPSNEYGPALVYLSENEKLYLYASDMNGDLDIYHLESDGIVNVSNALNSTSDDAYPTFGPDNSIYFTSNRGGDFDIYQTTVPEGADVLTWLTGTGNVIITKDEALSTSNNDKCPYINGTLLVFTSDRPGGYGGYDLYYSTYGTGGWSTPVNFGQSINTAYDEYRPVVVYAWGYSNDLMIFSSNRPGGKGGFDLYYVGIPKKTR